MVFSGCNVFVVVTILLMYILSVSLLLLSSFGTFHSCRGNMFKSLNADKLWNFNLDLDKRHACADPRHDAFQAML